MTKRFVEANRSQEMAVSFCMTLDSPIPRLKSTYGIYALLIAANLFMGMTILLQGRVIENQRVLIKNLFFDTTHVVATQLHKVAAR